MDDDTVARAAAVDRLGDLPWPDRPVERVSLARAAGRVLARPAEAPADVPATDRATMDGYAFAAAADGPLSVAGEVYPEDDPPALAEGEAVAVATGAPLPTAADTVLMQEEATVTDGELSGPDRPPGTNVYPAGATAAAGEVLLAAGQRVAPRHVTLLRDAGLDDLPVWPRLDVGLVPTGTEIHEGRQPDRDSEMLANLLRRWGHCPTIDDALPDDAGAVGAGIEAGVERHDALVTTGGTSVGSADHVVRTLREHDVLFRGVALRPGRPMTVATVDGTPVFALPGKPIAAYTAATLVTRAFFAGTAQLPTVPATAAADLAVPDQDVEFAVPVSLEDDETSEDALATPLGHAASSFDLYGERFAPGRVASSTRVSLADGVVLTRERLRAGEQVVVVPYEAVE
jgi:molybdopterin molybdotransferase